MPACKNITCFVILRKWILKLTQNCNLYPLTLGPILAEWCHIFKFCKKGWKQTKFTIIEAQRNILKFLSLDPPFRINLHKNNNIKGRGGFQGLKNMFFFDIYLFLLFCLIYKNFLKKVVYFLFNLIIISFSYKFKELFPNSVNLTLFRANKGNF